MISIPSVAAILVLTFLQAKPASMDDLIKGLTSETIEERSRAAKALCDRWKSWTQSELQLLRRFADSGPGQSSQQAKSVLSDITVYRSIPDELWRVFPDIGPQMVRSKPEELGLFMNELEARWKKGEISSKSIAALTIPLLGDVRETGIPWERRRFSSDDDPTRTVDDQVRLMHLTCLYWLDISAPAEPKRDWWKRNQEKTEEELHVEAMGSPNERTRGSAIARLALTRRTALYSRLFETLKGIQEDYAFRLAMEGVATLPAETMIPALRPYLADRRVEVRFAVVKALPASSKKECLDAMLDAFAHPERVEYAPWETHGYFDVLAWLVAAKDERAMKEVLASSTRGGWYGRRQGLEVLMGIETKDADLAMMQALQDPSPPSRGSGYIDGVNYRNERLCDLAAIYLSLKLGCGSEFSWESSIEKRNANIEEIQNRCRKQWSLSPTLYAGPGVVPVSKEEIAGLMPGVTHELPARRREAVTSLCRLGPGSWRPIKEIQEQAQGVRRQRLDEAIADWKVRLRSVISLDASVEALKRQLSAHIPKDFEPAFVIKEVVEFWLQAKDLKELSIELTDGGDAPGKSVYLAGGLRRASDEPPGATRISADGATYNSKDSQPDLESTLAKIFRKFEAESKSDRERQAAVSITLSK